MVTTQALTSWQWALVGLAAVLLAWAAAVVALVLAGRRADARALAGFVPDCVVLMRRLLGDRRLLRRRKAVLVLAVAYLALPFDLVPDFVPVAGQLDDAIVVLAALRYLLRGTEPGMLEELWPGPPESLRVVVRLAGRR